MADFMVAAAAFILIVVAVGLLRVLLGPTDADRLMSGQLLGTGGIAVLMLVAVATKNYAIIDVALLLALLSAFASVAFVLGGLAIQSEGEG